MNHSRPDILRIIEAARGDGWVLEPDAKRLFSLAGFAVPRFTLARSPEEASRFAGEIGYPVVAKVVSPRILHKSEVQGVAVGIADDGRLTEVFRRFQGLEGFLGMIVEEMVPGIELILGAKIDLQFGPMILLGMGGTGVEIYKDVRAQDGASPRKGRRGDVGGLRAHRLLKDTGAPRRWIEEADRNPAGLLFSRHGAGRGSSRSTSIRFSAPPAAAWWRTPVLSLARMTDRHPDKEPHDFLPCHLRDSPQSCRFQGQ